MGSFKLHKFHPRFIHHKVTIHIFVTFGGNVRYYLPYILFMIKHGRLNWDKQSICL